MIGAHLAVAIILLTGPVVTSTSECPDGCQCYDRWSVDILQHVHAMTCTGHVGQIRHDIGHIQEVVLMDIEKRHLHRALENVAKLNDVTNITMVHCPVKDLRRYKLVNVTHLSVSKSDMVEVGEKSFMHFNKLEVLLLRENGIVDTHEGAFIGLSSLRQLDISGNLIRHVDGEVFEDINTLLDLDLSHNMLTRLKCGTFRHLQELQQLNLSFNGMKSIDSCAFSDLPTLQQLILSDNSLVALPTHALWLPSQFTLDVSRNPVQHLSPNSLTKTNVSIVKINQMPVLQFVGARAFSDLPNLVSLEMKDNYNLKHVESGFVHDAPRLQRLDLSNNQLTTIQEDMPAHLPSLQRVKLRDNPFVCDCNIYWLRTDMITRQLNVSFDEDFITCSSKHGAHVLKAIGLSALGMTCAPRIAGLFKWFTTHDEDYVEMVCPAYGLPVPSIHWTLPSGHVLSAGESFDGRRVGTSGHLVVPLNVMNVAGNYTCVLHNDEGVARARYYLKVAKSHAEIKVLRVADTFITFTWRGVAPGYDYEVTYGKQGETLKRLNVGEYIKSVTINKLSPTTAYTICIRLGHMSDGNCKHVTTKDTTFSQRGITNVRQYAIGIIGAILGICIVIGLGLCFIVKRYNRIHRLKGESEIHLFASSVESLSSSLMYENRGASEYGAECDEISSLHSESDHVRHHTATTFGH